MRAEKATRWLLGALVIALAVGYIFALLLMAPRAGADPITHKSYVCKYVGTPGTDERLQTGQNPIWVDNSAIAEDPVVQGSYFVDAQGRSYVLVANTDKLDPEPSASECPQYAPKVTVEGPCGDPLYGFLFDNSASSVDVTFTVSYEGYVHRVPTPRTKSYTVAAGATLDTFNATDRLHIKAGYPVTVVASAANEPDVTLASFTAERSHGGICPWQEGQA